MTDSLSHYQDVAKRRRQKAEAQKRYKISEKGKLTQSKYYNSDAKRASNQRWREKHGWKTIAHKIVDKAVRTGKLLRMPCQVCGAPNAFAHHSDYSKPLDVDWLCNFHHAELHKSINYLNWFVPLLALKSFSR